MNNFWAASVGNFWGGGKLEKSQFLVRQSVGNKFSLYSNIL